MKNLADEIRDELAIVRVDKDRAAANHNMTRCIELEGQQTALAWCLKLVCGESE